MKIAFKPLEIALVAVSFAYLCVGTHVGMVYLDDGAWVLAAERILAGDIPYRDFMVLVSPAYYYLLACLFKLFGFQLMIERVLSCVFLALSSYVVYLIARRTTGSRAWGAVALFLHAAYAGDFSHFAGSQSAAIFLALLAIYFFIGHLENPSRRSIFYSGLATAGAVLFRQDTGIYALLAVVVTALIWARRYFYGYFAGFAVLIVPVAVYFLISVPIGDLVLCFVEYPSKIYPDFAELSFPLEVSYVLPIAVYTASFVVLWMRRIQGRRVAHEPAIVCITLSGALFFNQVRLRADLWHLLPTLGPALILLTIFMRWFWTRPTFRPAGRIAVYALILFLAFRPVATKAVVLGGMDVVPSGLPRARGISFLREIAGIGSSPEEFLNYEKAIQFVRKNVPEGEPIFIGSSRHNRICGADPLFYFLSARPSATKFHEMHRGYATREDIQKRIIQEIESKRVRYIVLRQMLDMVCLEPNASSQATGSEHLDRYIAENFVKIQEYGHELILKRTRQIS